jgi:acrylyl-CoA reductase (NADPH)
MAIGTAGYTAMLSVLALEHGGLTPQRDDILVTGANGGVGSIAIAILSNLGYRVVASTGRLEESDYLRSLGAGKVCRLIALSTSARTGRWCSCRAPVGRQSQPSEYNRSSLEIVRSNALRLTCLLDLARRRRPQVQS